MLTPLVICLKQKEMQQFSKLAQTSFNALLSYPIWPWNGPDNRTICQYDPYHRFHIFRPLSIWTYRQSNLDKEMLLQCDQSCAWDTEIPTRFNSKSKRERKPIINTKSMHLYFVTAKRHGSGGSVVDPHTASHFMARCSLMVEATTTQLFPRRADPLCDLCFKTMPPCSLGG